MKSRQVARFSRNFGKVLLVCGFFWFAAACALSPAAPTLVPTPVLLEPTVMASASTPLPTVIVETVTETVTETAAESSTALTDTAVADTDTLTTAESLTTSTNLTAVTAAEPLTATAPVTPTQPTTQVAQPAVPEADQPVVALLVGVNAEFDPFEYIDDAGQLVGFDIDLINALAQAASIEVSFVDMDFNGLIPAVVAGEIDVAISAISRTEERAEQVAFTDPYFTTDQSPVSFFSGGQGLAVRTDTTMIQTAADLTADIRVGVKSGTTGDFFVVENTAAEIVRFDEAPVALAALANGDVDAVVTDISVIAEFVTDHPELNVQLMGKPLTVEAYAIAVSQERMDLLQILNAALTNIQEDGTYDQIFEKWFQLP